MNGEKKDLKKLIVERKKENRFSIVSGIVASGLLTFMLYHLGDYRKGSSFGIFTETLVLLLVGICVGVIGDAVISSLRRTSNEYITELQEVENELDLLSISHSSLEERSEKLFKHHHFELKRYYDENLKQSSWIFVVGIACILIGFAIIGITLYFLIANSSNELENKIIVASVGAIGAILSNFIAVIYLKMHSEAVKSLTEFHNRFVNTHHFYFGNFLLSKIQSEDKREDALVELALKINGISPKAPAQGEENK